jgi:tetratricopeptide (TPR) repeat protein
MMEQMMRELAGTNKGTPLDQAQELIFQAFQSNEPTEKELLARRALALSADCADAHTILAENAPNRKAALPLHEQALAAGERALGEAFQGHVGHFWGVLETRPYMRARLGLAQCLWTHGRRDEAIGHAEEMLRLNPSDNQGVRYILAGWLLAQDRDAEVLALLNRFSEEGSASWQYTRALLVFRQQGDTTEARELLRRALQANGYVPDYLLGKKYPPAEGPSSYSPGQESEALVYLPGFLPAWKSTDGAIAWIRKFRRDEHPPAPGPQPRGPIGFIKNWLKNHLPQVDEVWQADFQLLSTWIGAAGEEKARPWGGMVVNTADDMVLGHEILLAPPTSKHAWDLLANSMQHPVAGAPRRPMRLQVLDHPFWRELETHLKDVGILCSVEDRLEHFEPAVAGLNEHLAGHGIPGLLTVPGMTPERVRSFYEAAALFFRRAPWRKMGYESAIKVECPGFPNRPWFAVVMGQSGLTTGLVLYDNYGTLAQMWGEGATGQRMVPSTALSVMYGEEWCCSLADLDAGKRNGWEVARSDAYPFAIRKEPDDSLSRPTVHELELLDACLRAIPDFVDRRKQNDPTPEEVPLALATGEVRLGLSWVVQTD